MKVVFDIAPDNCEFGSAPEEFWKHADFSRAWIDGQRHRSTMHYLHVPCHVEDEGSCNICDDWGWTGSVHRLWPKWWPYKAYCGPEDERPPHKVNGAEIISVFLSREGNQWKWILTA